MAIATWLRAVDALTNLIDITRQLRAGGRRERDEEDLFEPAADGRRREPSLPAPTERAGLGQIEARLAGVVVAALKEAFDRDRTRLDLEREQIEAEQRRAETALRMELRRQAGERAHAQLRLLVGITVLVWIVSAALAVFVPGMHGTVPKILLGLGWALLVAALACGLAGFSALSGWIASAPDDRAAVPPLSLQLMPWLLLAGLAFGAVSVLTAL